MLRVQRIILYGSTFLIFLGCSNAHATRSQSCIYMRKHFSCTDSLPTSELLQAIKSYVDSSCPKRLDNVTTMDSVSIIGRDTLQYNYSLDLNRSGFNTEKMKALLSKQIQKGLNTSLLRRKKIIIVYSYKDSTKTFWFREILAPSNNYVPE